MVIHQYKNFHFNSRPLNYGLHQRRVTNIVFNITCTKIVFADVHSYLWLNCLELYFWLNKELLIQYCNPLNYIMAWPKCFVKLEHWKPPESVIFPNLLYDCHFSYNFVNEIVHLSIYNTYFAVWIYNRCWVNNGSSDVFAIDMQRCRNNRTTHFWQGMAGK